MTEDGVVLVLGAGECDDNDDGEKASEASTTAAMMRRRGTRGIVEIIPYGGWVL